MPTNSTTRIQDIVKDCQRRTDVGPALSSAGSSDQPALMMANEVMNALIRGGPDGQRMNWKWNRMNVVPSPLGVMSQVGGFGTFLTNTWQQDYAVPGVVLCDWLEEAPYVNINMVQQPKQVLWADPKRNLSEEYIAIGTNCWKICFLPNYLMRYGVWGQSQQFQVAGMNNPGPGVTYANPLGANVAPNNACTQILDPAHGNYYALTTYGTCGSTTPSFPSTVVYPTPTAQTTVATTVADGSCVWTALNPNGQGFRLSSPPPSNNVVWLFRVICQMVPPVFTALNQTLGILPDDHVPFFRAGFEAKCLQRSPDPKVRARFSGPEGEWALWLKALRNAVQAGCREQEDQQLVPVNSGANGGAGVGANPLYPFPQGW